jgi:hypothetical protein
MQNEGRCKKERLVRLLLFTPSLTLCTCVPQFVLQPAKVRTLM